MATKEKAKSKTKKKASKKKALKKLAKKSPTLKKKSAKKKKTAPKRAAAKTRLASKKKTARKKSHAPRKQAAKGPILDTAGFTREGLRARSGGQSGDLQGLSNREGADSESVDELLEEGNAFEADVVKGVEDAVDEG
jgi:hypothetical protein